MPESTAGPGRIHGSAPQTRIRNGRRPTKTAAPTLHLPPGRRADHLRRAQGDARPRGEARRSAGGGGDRGRLRGEDAGQPPSPTHRLMTSGGCPHGAATDHPPVKHRRPPRPGGREPRARRRKAHTPDGATSRKRGATPRPPTTTRTRSMRADILRARRREWLTEAASTSADERRRWLVDRNLVAVYDDGGGCTLHPGGQRRRARRRGGGPGTRRDARETTLTRRHGRRRTDIGGARK